MLRGDTHVFSYGELRYQGKPVVLEVGTAGISSPAGKRERAAEIEAANPHILFLRPRPPGLRPPRGREAVEVSFSGFSTVLEPDGRRILLRRFRIPRS